MIEWLLEVDKQIGLGFHPDTRGDDYTPPLPNAEEFEAKRQAYFAACAEKSIDPYEFAMFVQPSFKHLTS